MGIFLVRRSLGETTGFGCRLPLELDFVGSLGALLQGALAADLHIWVILDPTSGCLLLKLPFHLHRLCLMSISIGHMLVSISLIIQIFFLNPNSCEWLIGLNYSHVFNQLFLDFTTIVLQQSPIFSLFFWAQLGHKNCGCWVAPAVPGPCEGVWMRLRSCTLALANMGGIHPPILWRDVCKCIDKNMWLW